MAVSISRTDDEVRDLPLVELAVEILKTTKEPFYFRDLMKEIQDLRGMTDDEVNEVIARLYTEINIDGRFVCIGQNVWGLKRWYPVDKVADRAPTSKKFVRAKSSGDAFSDDDEELEDLTEEDSDDEFEDDSDGEFEEDFDNDSDEDEDEEDSEESIDEDDEDFDGDDEDEEEADEDIDELADEDMDASDDDD